MKEARVIISVKNNILLTMIEGQHGSIKKFAEKYDLTYQAVCALVSLTLKPKNNFFIYSLS